MPYPLTESVLKISFTSMLINNTTIDYGNNSIWYSMYLCGICNIRSIEGTIAITASLYWVGLISYIDCTNSVQYIVQCACMCFRNIEHRELPNTLVLLVLALVLQVGLCVISVFAITCCCTCIQSLYLYILVINALHLYYVFNIIYIILISGHRIQERSLNFIMLVIYLLIYSFIPL